MCFFALRHLQRPIRAGQSESLDEEIGVKMNSSNCFVVRTLVKSCIGSNVLLKRLLPLRRSSVKACWVALEAVLLGRVAGKTA